MNPSTSQLFSLLESKATYTVEEAIDKIGYGPFQVKLMLVIGLAWVSFSKGLLRDSLMIIFCYDMLRTVGSRMASWLVRSTPEQAVRVRSLVGTFCCVLG